MLKNNISHGRVSVRALKHVWKGTLNSVHEAVYYKRSYYLLIMFNARVPCSLCELAPYLHLQGEKESLLPCTRVLQLEPDECNLLWIVMEPDFQLCLFWGLFVSP